MKGIDLSSNNPSVDFEQVKADGYGLDFLKATEGATYHDPTFHERFQASKKAGLLTGAYNFARPETSTALEEVQSFVETVNAAGGFEVWPEFPGHYAGALDLEDRGGKSSEELQAFAEEWLTEFEKLTGKKGWLYTGLSFYHEYGLQTVIEKTGAELWIAAYGQAKPDVKEAIWQETSSGHIKGVAGDVDIDVVEGSAPAVPAPARSLPVGTYTVKSGDTLSQISLHTRVPVGVLSRFNRLENPNVLSVGEVLHIPHPYRIKGGDTFYALSQRYHVAVSDIEHTNSNLNPLRLQTGDLVWL